MQNGLWGYGKIRAEYLVFFENITSQQNTKVITNLKVLSLGSSGLSNFTALGQLIMALGIGTPGVQLVIVG
jgi:hypothetical protein